MPEAQQINTGTSLDSVIGSLNGKPMDTPTYQKGETALIKESEKVRKEEKDTPLSTPPKLTEAPDQKDYTTNPMQTFGSFGMVLASLGSLMTKHPMTAALNSGAEVFKAKNAGDAAGYKNAMDKWKVDSENAWKMADWDQKNFENMRNKYKDDLEGLNREAELWAAATKNPSLDAAVKAGQVQQYMDSHKKAAEEMNDAMENKKKKNAVYEGKIDDWLEQNKNPDGTTKDIKEIPKKITAKIIEESENEWNQIKTGKLQSGATAAVKYEAWKEKPSSIKDANDYANGSPLANFMRSRGKDGGEYLQMVKDLAAELHPDYDRNQAVQDYNAANKAISAFGNGKQGDIVRSLNVAYSHINLVSDLAKALDNGDVKKINDLSQSFEEQFGNPAPTNFDAAKRILADEITKAVIGSAGALTDREGTADTVSRANSYDQTAQGLDTFKGLMRGQLGGLKRQYEQATKRDDFDRLLGADVKDDLKNYEGKKGAGGSDVPTDDDISHLKANPSDKASFNKYFGAGAAEKILRE